MTIKRRVEVLERNAPSTKATGWDVIFYTWSGDPWCAYVSGPNGTQHIARADGESAEAFEARCRTRSTGTRSMMPIGQRPAMH